MTRGPVLGQGSLTMKGSSPKARWLCRCEGCRPTANRSFRKKLGPVVAEKVDAIVRAFSEA